MNGLPPNLTHNLPVQSTTRQKKLFAPRSVIPFILTFACLAIGVVTANSPQWGYVCLGAWLGFFIGVLHFSTQFLGRIIHGQWLGAFWAFTRAATCILALWPPMFLVLFVFGRMWDEPDFSAPPISGCALVGLESPTPRDLNFGLSRSQERRKGNC